MAKRTKKFVCATDGIGVTRWCDWCEGLIDTACDDYWMVSNSPVGGNDLYHNQCLVDAEESEARDAHEAAEHSIDCGEWAGGVECQQPMLG